MTPTPPDELTLDHPELARALEASRQGDVDAALAACRDVAARWPQSALPPYLAGVILAQAGRYREAEDPLTRATLLAPGLDEARFQLGLAHFVDGRLPQALLAWQPLAQREPADAIARFVQAFAASAGGDVAAAVRLLQEGLSMGHPNPALMADMARMLQRAEAELPDAAAAPRDDVDAADASTGDQHVLLAGYQQTGKLH